MRRAIVVVAGTIVVMAGLGALLLAFNSRDDAGIDAPAGAAGPGELERDRGAGHRETPEDLSAEPPTSGPHPDGLPDREGAWTDGQVLHALELGNVVLIHSSNPPPDALTALQEALSGPFEPALARAGQAVIVVRRPDSRGIQALAWRRRLVVASDDDPRLREFAEAWLGKGAPAAG